MGMYKFVSQGCAYALMCANLLAEELASCFLTDPTREEAELVLCKVAEQIMLEGKATAELKFAIHLVQAPFLKAPPRLAVREAATRFG